ncbi:hypothetical protein SRB5_25090 [Streptomyces sp. RB5]|uniref:HupE/UreJ family protein n=1 Tax=Streptomyces smaragdinus TaxID=2585196 RepID=A0A7K0CG51_9ACTN|nr:HupE/UreJ family protein [Streptomyces smaragdinus]MQY12376.1 hypothetical protein [Streptomyces smaragdinus]
MVLTPSGTPPRTLAVRGGALALLLGCFLLGGLFRPAPAAAHDATTTAYATVTGSRSAGISATLDLEYDLLMKSAWLYASAYDAKGRTEQLRQLRLNADAVAEYVTGRFAVTAGSARCVPSVGPADVHARGGRSFVLLPVSYDCGPGEPAISSALFPDGETFVHGTRTIVRYSVDGASGSTVLTTADPTVRVGQDRTSHQVGEFFRLGAEHLVLGLDHVLFLLTLILGARTVREVVWSASAFTAAHSITFLLAALGVVDVPSGLVEPVIAASIAVTAAAGLWLRDDPRLTRGRLPVIFLFGLIHGLGFAGALGIADSWSWDLLLSLLSFNAGIEAAQLTLIALLFPLLLLLRRTPAHRRLLPALTAPIIAVSLWWLVDRIPVGA